MSMRLKRTIKILTLLLWVVFILLKGLDAQTRGDSQATVTRLDNGMEVVLIILEFIHRNPCLLVKKLNLPRLRKVKFI